MGRIKWINDQAPNPSRYPSNLRWHKNMPTIATIDGSKYSDAGIGVSRQIGLSGTAIDYGWICGIDCQRTNVQCRLAMPQRPPVSATIVASPNTATSGACPDCVGLFRGACDRRHATADVGWADQL